MRAQETVERALALSSADGCVVIAKEQSSANLRWANNSLTTNGLTRARQLTVIATIAGATGTAAGAVSQSAVREDELEALVRAAEQAAREAGPAEDAQPLVASSKSAEGWDADPAETSIDVFKQLATDLGEALTQARFENRLLFGFAEHTMISTYLGSSTGLRLRHDQPTGTVEIAAKSPDFSRSAWVGRATRDFSDVDVTILNAELTQRLAWAERTIELPAGRYETLLPPPAVADLMIYLYMSTTAREAHDGHTVFSQPGGGTRVGEALTPLPVTLRSDPYAPGLECPPFLIAPASSSESSVFDNGLPLGPTDWIRDGTLTALLQTRHSAQLTGLAVTPWIDNLILEAAGSPSTLTEMTTATKRGLVLTCLWYIREVDPQTLLLTGLTRDGVYLVENGEIIGAVNNFRFNESPVDLLRRVTEIGHTEHTLPREWKNFFTRAAMPPLRIPDFTMSSVSQAS